MTLTCMRRIIALNLAALAFVACADEDAARKHLHNQGYTNVVTTGYAFGACSKDDTYATEFHAVLRNTHKTCRRATSSVLA